MRLDRGHVVVGAGEHAEAAVDRIRHQRADGEDGIELLGRGRRERHETTSRLRSAASSSRPRNAPESVMAPSCPPPAPPVCARNSVTSTRSSSVSARMTPTSPATASKASTEPASEPVCAIAACRPPSDWPSLSATMCLPAARAIRQAALEFFEIGDRLHIDDDHLQLGLVGEERDVVAGREPALVAAGDEIFGRDAALLERRNWRRSSCRRSGRRARPGLRAA